MPPFLIRTMKQDMTSQGASLAEKDLSIKKAPSPVFSSIKPPAFGAPSDASRSAPPNLPVQPKEKSSLDIPATKPVITESIKMTESVKPVLQPSASLIASKPEPAPILQQANIAPKPVISPSIATQNRLSASLPSKPEEKKPDIPPIKPLVPPGEEIKKITAKSSSGFKFALAAGLVLIALTLAAGGWYWWQKDQNPPVVENSPTPTPISTPTQTPVRQPDPLFAMDSTEISILNYPPTEASKEQTINILANTSRNPGFSHIIFKNNENNFLTFRQATDYFGITFFNSIGASSDDLLNPEQFSFFIYSRETSSSSPFNPNNRAGAVVAVKYQFQDDSQLMQAIKSKEDFILQETSTLFLNNQIDLPSDKGFQDNIYKEIPIRYINLPTSEISLDYAVVNNLLVVATSKQSMYAAIDRILESSGK